MSCWARPCYAGAGPWHPPYRPLNLAVSDSSSKAHRHPYIEASVAFPKEFAVRIGRAAVQMMVLIIFAGSLARSPDTLPMRM